MPESRVSQKQPSRLPAFLLAALVTLVVLSTGNLSGFGIGAGSFLYDSVALPRLVVALVLTLASWSAWLFLAEREDRVRLDPTALMLTALAAWGLLSTVLSPHRALALLGQSERLEGVLTLILYTALYTIALQVLRTVRDVRLVATCLAASSVALSVWGLMQYTGNDPTNYAFEQYAFDLHRAFANFGNPNFLAGLLVLTLPMAIAIAVTAERAWVRAAWAAGAVLIACALFATFARGAWLAVAVEVPFGLFVWSRTLRARVSRPAIIGILIGVLALSVMVVVSLRAPAERNVVTSVTEVFEQIGSTSERSLLVGISLAAGAKRPLVGYGPDTFLPAFRLHRSEAYVDAFRSNGIVDNAHSWPLQYVATLGFVGAALLLIALATALWRSRAAITRAARTDSDLMRAALWTGCAGYSLYLMLSVSVLGATIPLFLVLGALGAPRAVARRGAPLHPRTHFVSAIVCAVLSVAIAGIGASFIYADAIYLQSRVRFVAADHREARRLARTARTANPLSVKYARGAAEASGQMVVDAIREGASDEQVRAAYAVALGDYERVLRLDPNDYPALAWLAALQARVATRLADESLRANYAATVRRAAALDVHHSEVGPLLGSPTPANVIAAEGVPRLP